MTEDRRRVMLERDLMGRGITDPAVLEAMGRVPREAFVDTHLADAAYADRALPIGRGQTISQPYVVAWMAQALELIPSDRVLEVGTGSGYAAAVLAEVAAEVWTIERDEELAAAAASRLVELGYTNIHLRCGDGSVGWPEHAPFDAIAVSACAPDVPAALVDQLGEGGRLVVPVGSRHGSQDLVKVVRLGDEVRRSSLGGVAFVPLVGDQGFAPQRGRWRSWS